MSNKLNVHEKYLKNKNKKQRDVKQVMTLSS